LDRFAPKLDITRESRRFIVTDGHVVTATEVAARAPATHAAALEGRTAVKRSKA
jgi:hypothetical protein